MKQKLVFITVCALALSLFSIPFVPRTTAQDVSYTFATGWKTIDSSSVAYTYQSATISAAIQPDVFDWSFYPTRDTVAVTGQISRGDEKLPLYVSNLVGGGAPGSGIEDRVTFIEFFSFIPTQEGEYFFSLNGTLNNVAVSYETTLYVLDAATAMFPAGGRASTPELLARIADLEARLATLEAAAAPGS